MEGRFRGVRGHLETPLHPPFARGEARKFLNLMPMGEANLHPPKRREKEVPCLKAFFRLGYCFPETGGPGWIVKRLGNC